MTSEAYSVYFDLDPQVVRPGATVPSSPREAEYLSRRKLSLVNGMHTVLAFLTLRELFVPAERIRVRVAERERTKAAGGVSGLTIGTATEQDG